MKVNVRSEKGNWILPKCAMTIRDVAPNIVRWDQQDELWPDPDIEYGVNYGYVARHANCVRAAMFCHYNPAVNGQLFLDVARQMDRCVAMSQATKDVLEQHGIPSHRIRVIEVGIDPIHKPKLVLGVLGRCYEGSTKGRDTRKGRDLLKAFIDAPWVRQNVLIHVMGEGWFDKDYPMPRHVTVDPFVPTALPHFYSMLDYMLCTSTIEGGPVPLLEALAHGIPTIIPPIGYAQTFPAIHYTAGQLPSLLQATKGVYASKLKRIADYTGVVQHLTWERWGRMHIQMFQDLARSS